MATKRAAEETGSDQYPNFWRCIDALCFHCAGKTQNHTTACFMPPFGWIHVWIKGNGHSACAAAQLWEIAPNKEERSFNEKREATHAQD